MLLTRSEGLRGPAGTLPHQPVTGAGHQGPHGPFLVCGLEPPCAPPHGPPLEWRDGSEKPLKSRSAAQVITCTQPWFHSHRGQNVPVIAVGGVRGGASWLPLQGPWRLPVSPSLNSSSVRAGLSHLMACLANLVLTAEPGYWDRRSLRSARPQALSLVTLPGPVPRLPHPAMTTHLKRHFPLALVRFLRT